MENGYIGTNCSPKEIHMYTEHFKEFCDVIACLYEEMHDIYPNIVEHEIKTYLNVKHVRQNLCLINPQKATTIKVEVENMLNAGFIYHVPLNDWVSNPVLVRKKQGNLRVCMDFRDLNKACSKYNLPTPFIDQIIDECVGSEMLYLMDGFSRYHQIQIRPKDQHKTTFIFSLGYVCI